MTTITPAPRQLFEPIARAIGLCTAEQLTEASDWMDQGVQRATSKNQHKAFAQWKIFLNTFRNDGSDEPDPYMLLQSQEQTLSKTALYVKYQRTTLQRTPVQIRSHLSSLNSNWISKGFGSCFTTITKDQRNRMLKAVPATEEEVRTMLKKKRDNVKLPIPKEMREEMFEELWVTEKRHHPAAEAMDKMVSVLGLMLNIETASRGGNWTGKYATKTQDLRFQVQTGSSEETRGIPPVNEIPGHRLQEIIKITKTLENPLGWQPDKVIQVAIDHLRTKNGEPVENIVIARRTPEESRLLDMMIEWLMLSNPTRDEPFLTRHGICKKRTEMSAKRCTSRMVTQTIKTKAEKMGLNPDLFSGRSGRSTGKTEMSQGGITGEESDLRSGHKKGSRVGGAFYKYGLSHSEGGRGVSRGGASMTSGHFTMENLKLLVPPSVLTAPGRNSSKLTNK